MPGDLAPPKAGAKGVAFDRLHTAPKADQIPEGLKTPKRQHSSRFDVSEKRELEKLPGFHGMPPISTLLSPQLQFVVDRPTF